jgi:hypothetical protein
MILYIGKKAQKYAAATIKSSINAGIYTIFIIYTDYISGVNCENSLVCIAICEIFGIIAASFCFEVSF